MILVIRPRLEGRSVIFLAIQTHPSSRFLLAVDSLGLRRSESSSQFFDPPQDFSERVTGHCDPTVNLYDWLVGIRRDAVECLWPVTARGAVL